VDNGDDRTKDTGRVSFPQKYRLRTPFGDIGYGIRTWPDGAGGEMRKPNDNSFGVAISHPSICLFQPKNKKEEVEMEVGC